MRLSIFSVVDHYPERQRSIAALYDQVIAQCVRAEELGFDSFLIAEHHFHEYGAVPDPVVLLPVLALRTSRIRLGPAVAVLPFRNPIEVAESYAMVDLLSHGRLVLGVGSGYLKHEFDGFGIDPAEKRERFDEALSILTRLLSAERVSYDGRYHTLNDVALNVAPVQKPHPPIYVAILRKEAAFHVGRSGNRIMSIPYASADRFEDVRWIIEEFRRGRADAGLSTSPDDAMFAFHCHVAKSDEAARAAASEAFDLYVATRLYARRQTYDDILQSGLGLFGSVETVAAKLVRLQQWGIRDVALLMDFGLMPADRVHRSMDLVAREVAPKVQARFQAGTAKP
jgi:alkanesulfonate monooxygenase SsuD/methylene tetrahydromethanopterin reductase-like flavin-dependent oxidoreductase (luciferase family)